MKNFSDEKKILESAKKQKLLRPKDFENIKGARVHLSRLVESGKLVKIGRGLYSIAETDFNEQQSFLETARLVPKGVICLLSASRFHELTTQNPFEVWIAIEGMSRKPNLETIPLNVFRFSGSAFTQGIETHEIEGVTLRVYAPAKTVADCFKYRNKIGLDVAIEALRDVWNQKKATMDDLWHYARICRMTNVMRPYLESLV
jgi:predicted transcriptional regulator of viral defense system